MYVDKLFLLKFIPSSVCVNWGVLEQKGIAHLLPGLVDAVAKRHSCNCVFTHGKWRRSSTAGLFPPHGCIFLLFINELLKIASLLFTCSSLKLQQKVGSEVDWQKAGEI